MAATDAQAIIFRFLSERARLAVGSWVHGADGDQCDEREITAYFKS